MEFFKNFDQNSCQKTKSLPLGEVDQFQWRKCHKNSSKIPITKSDDSGILKDFDQNSGEKL